MDIRKKYREIENARREKLKQVMQEYDETIYYPARQNLIQECEKQGHVFGSIGDNGFECTWYNCAKCNGRYNITNVENEE